MTSRAYCIRSKIADDDDDDYISHVLTLRLEIELNTITERIKKFVLYLKSVKNAIECGSFAHMYTMCLAATFIFA